MNCSPNNATISPRARLSPGANVALFVARPKKAAGGPAGITAISTGIISGVLSRKTGPNGVPGLRITRGNTVPSYVPGDRPVASPKTQHCNQLPPEAVLAVEKYDDTSLVPIQVVIPWACFAP